MSETDQWLQSLRSNGRKESTIRTHRGNVHRCLLCLIADGRTTEAAGIGPDDVMHLWRSLEVKESVRTAYLRSLAGMVAFHTGRDVVKGTNILHNRAVNDRIFITEDEFIAAYSAADPFQCVILCLGAYMGLRRGEMAAIRDGDLSDGILTVHGKGHGEEGLVFKMQVPEPVIAAVNAYRSSPMKAGERMDDHLLQTRDHRGRLHGAHVSRISDAVSRLAKATGSRMTTHSLRRFYATSLYYETGCDIQTVRSLMRHSDVTTTLRCYVDACDIREKKASEALTRYIGSLLRTD